MKTQPGFKASENGLPASSHYASWRKSTQVDSVERHPVINEILPSALGDAPSINLPSNGIKILSTETKKPLSILIIRLSAIGDIVFASPLIGALRRRYPCARLVWLVQSGMQGLLEHHPDLDEVILWPRDEWRSLAKQGNWLELLTEILGFRRKLRHYRFDMILDIQGLLKSGFFVWLCNAEQKIGLGSREGSQWLMTRVIDRGGDSKRIGSEYLYLAQQLNLPTEPFEMRIGLSESDRRHAMDLMRNEGLHEGYLVICPFTTRPQKHWFEASWLELIPRLHARFGLPVLMLGGASDRQAAQRMMQHRPSGLIDLVGRTRLGEAAALIEHAALLVGVDTGLTHMGIAFSRPTICLFGSTCPYLDTAHENAVVIYHRLECSPCKRHPTCDGRFDCMRTIKTDEVLSVAERLHAEDGP